MVVRSCFGRLDNGVVDGLGSAFLLLFLVLALSLRETRPAFSAQRAMKADMLMNRVDGSGFDEPCSGVLMAMVVIRFAS